MTNALFALGCVLLPNSVFAAWTNTGYKIYWDDMSVVYIGTDGTRQAPFLDSALTQEMTLTSNPKPFDDSYYSCNQGSVLAFPASTGAAVYKDGYITQAGLDEVAAASGNLYWGGAYACSYECPSGRYFRASDNTCSLCPSGYICQGVTIDQNNVNSDQGKEAGYVITLNANGGTGGTTEIYAKSDGAYILKNGTLTLMATSGTATRITNPTKSGWTFMGYYRSTTDSNNSYRYINNNGNITSYGNNVAKALNANATWYARWSITCAAGTYFRVSDGTCQTCPAGSYCAGATVYSNAMPTTNTGIASCNTGNISGYTSPAGATTVTQCYKTENKPCSELNPISAANNITGATYATSGNVTCTRNLVSATSAGNCLLTDPTVCNITGVQCATGYNPTTTGSDLTNLPSNPDGSDIYYRSNNPNSTYSNTALFSPGEFQVSFSGPDIGLVHGYSRCSTMGTSYGETTTQTPDNNGNKCWCKIDKFSTYGSGGVTKPISSEWVYIDYSDIYYSCEVCAQACAQKIQTNDDNLRTNLYSPSVLTQFACTPQTYNISYTLNGGTIFANAPTTYTVETPTITLGTPTHDHATFAGWYTESSFTNKVTQIANGSTGNKSLYAKWTCATGYSGTRCTARSINCAAGQYLKASNATCTTCPAGSYCDGGTYTYNGSDQGILECPENWTSAAGATAQTQCFRSVTLNRNGMTTGTLTLPSNSGCKSLTNTDSSSSVVEVYYDTTCNLPTTVVGGTATGTTFTGTGSWATSANAASGFVTSIKTTSTNANITYYSGKMYSCDPGYALAKNTNGACLVCGSSVYCPGITNIYYSSSDQGYTACSKLAKPSSGWVTGGTYSSVKPRLAPTDCRYTPPAMKTVPEHCSNVTANTVSYNGTGWNTNLYTVTSASGNYITANNNANPTCAVCDSKYPNSAANSTKPGQCYLTLTAGKQVATAGAGTSNCSAGKYCASTGNIYYNSDGGTATYTGTQCATGSYSSAGASSCTACQNGTTTSGAGQSSCNATCLNATNSATWASAVWNNNNTVSDLCALATCATGYDKMTESLPSGYTPIEYIQTPGSAYINTGIVPNDNTTMDITWYTKSTGSDYFSGARIEPKSTIIFAQYSGSSSSTIGASVKGKVMVANTDGTNWARTTSGARYNSILTTNNGTYDYYIHDYTNNRKFAASKDYTPIGTVDTPVYILSLNTTSVATANTRMYKYKLTKSGSVVFNGIPAKNASGVAGLYDTVSGNFFDSDGSSAFTAGAEVSSYKNTCYLTQYSISYNLDGGTNFENAPTTYNINTPTITLGTPTKTGYTFGGWFTNSGFTGTAVTQITNGSTGNKTFYAKWTVNTSTITYILNGGTNFANAPTSYTVETATITLGTPTKTGYTFGGWYDNSDFAGTAITKITKGSTGNKTLYAKWTANTINLVWNGVKTPGTSTTFTAVSGRANTYQSQVVYNGDIITPQAAVSATGQVFKGWRFSAASN